MIIYRLVEWGTPSAIAWLRATYGDDAIYDAIARIRSRGLAYKKVQRWVLRAEYARWAAERPPSLWEGR